MRQSQKNYKRIVIKIGSSLFYSKEDALDCGLLNEITSQVCDVMAQGKEILLVSSGAIAIGMSVLKMHSRPKNLSYLQAAAAIGQHELMDNYRKFFKYNRVNCAQVLLTWEDFDERSMTGADLLIMLSDVEGLLDKDKKVIRIVDRISPELQKLACPSEKRVCVGGMITKLEAAKIAIGSGIPCVIADGRVKDVIKGCVENPAGIGTLFVAKNEALAAKERWIAFGTKPKGRIYVDEGARRALINKKSLLSVGVISCEGKFANGDIVSVRDERGDEIARGKSGISSEELAKVKGMRHDKEVIHRDNIVIL